MALQIQEFLQQIDLFAKPFVFFVGDKKSKSTLLGGLLSVCILTVSIVYAYYVLDMYFDKKVQPKLTQSIAIENGLNTLHVNENFFIFEMLIKGEPLKRYEKRVGKQYLNYTIYYENIGSDGESTYKIAPLVECDDPQFDGFLCIPSEFFKGGKDLYYQPMQQQSTDYAITIEPCNKKLFDNCASEEEIHDIIFRPYNYIQLFTKVVQYNTNEREYKVSYKQELWYIDQKLTAYTSLDLFKGTTAVTEGMLYQTTESRDTIYDYKRTDSFFTNDDTLMKRMGFEGYLCILFELNQVHNYIYVQHAMITEILAQFMSIFNSMLLVGFVARMFAESNIVDDLNNILLKNYYKQTALKLIKKQEEKQFQALNKKNYQNVKKSQENAKISSQQVKIEQSNNTSIQDEIIKLQNKIGQTDFSKKQNKYFQLDFLQKCKVSILSLFGKHSLINFKPDKKPDPVIYKNLIQQSMKRINIFEVYRDLIKLKMVIKLLLTKDQYAAIHFCGSDLASDQEFSSKININHKKNNQKKKIEIIIPHQDKVTKFTDNLFENINSQRNQSPNFISSEIIHQINSETNFKVNNIYNQIQTNSQIQQTQITLLNNQKMEDEQSPKKLNPITPYEEQNKKKQSSQLKYQKQIINYNNQINIKKSLQIELRDNVQSLNLKGDDIIIDTFEQLSDNLSDKQQIQKDFIQIKQQIQDKPKLINLNTCFSSNRIKHLQEMDIIEEDIKQREKFLQEFLVKMSQPEGTVNNDISHIDKQIYSSLIFNE